MGLLKSGADPALFERTPCGDFFVKLRCESGAFFSHSLHHTKCQKSIFIKNPDLATKIRLVRLHSNRLYLDYNLCGYKLAKEGGQRQDAPPSAGRDRTPLLTKSGSECRVLLLEPD